MFENKKTAELEGEICLIILWNDVVKSRRVSDALNDIERDAQNQIIGVKMFTPTRELMDRFYPKDESFLKRLGANILNHFRVKCLSPDNDELGYGRIIRESLLDYGTEGSIFVVMVMGPNIIARMKVLVGDNNPSQANPGTMRARYASDRPSSAALAVRALRNGIYCSYDRLDALRIMELFLSKEELRSL